MMVVDLTMRREQKAEVKQATAVRTSLSALQGVKQNLKHGFLLTDLRILAVMLQIHKTSPK